MNKYRYDESKRYSIRKQYGIDDCKVIGHVGHFADVKNQQYLVSLLPQLIENKEKIVLMLLGDGETTGKIMDLIHSMNLENHVIITGNVNNVGDYLSAMDVFAFPSKYEGMPLSLIEAQANGLPCVISKTIPKDIYLTNLVTPLPVDDDSIIKWINCILSLGRNKPEQYFSIIEQTGYSTDTMLAEIYKIYEGGNNFEWKSNNR